MTAIVQFVFEGQPTVALPRLLDLLREGLRQSDREAGRIASVTLSGLTFEAPGLRLSLSMVLSGTETIVRVALDLDDVHGEVARLAPLAWQLAKAVDAHSVIWHDTTLRIPRAAFVAGLAAQFEGTGTPMQADRIATAKPVAPRRVTTSRVSPRPVSPRPAMPRSVTQARTNRRSDRPYDAHVTAFEQNVATELRRAPTPGEMALLRAEYEPEKNRMSVLTTGAGAALQSAELRAASLVICVTSLVLASGANNLV
ncbi:hypothetical protein [Sagittula salina]|uniref:Uncharacterized protein n=1 Tax=Sagittula salina TaxID=2820268 RepID=A0A940RZK0_9RHOB|nr:hypothetical protein [Sagittula salina]MBP0481067.1 hypothetical protein [Sagittula salina]